MKGLIAWAVLGCLLLAACPGDRSQSQTGGPSPGRYAEYADLFKRQAGFEAELKRLQELSAGDPNLAGVSTGSAQLQYKLGMRVGKDRIGAVVRDNSSGAEHVLWVWEDTVGDQGMPKMIDQQANSGGMSVEYQLDNDIFLSLSLRWVQDRYLEVKRTFEAGGLDMEYEMGSGYTSWSLESDPLPYRLSPGIEGPFGIVNKERADGGWYGAAYPRDMMLPAVAAFDQSGGLLLAISDEHPRRLDREYGVWWRLTGRQHDPDDNVQLKIDYGIYNSTVDRTTDPVLLSGLPQRDSVVLEPFSLVATGMEDSFMAGTTEQVAGHMSDFVAAFHARYAAEEPQAKHLMLVLDGLERDSARLDGILRLKTGLWNVQDLLLAGDPDELPESSKALAAEFGIRSWSLKRPFSLPGNSPILQDDPELRLQLDSGKDMQPVALSLRRPATADRLLSDFADRPGGTAYVLDPDIVEDRGQDPARMPLVCSQPAAATLLTMKLCEENSKREDPLQLAILGLPSLGCPPSAARYFLPAPDGQSVMQQRMLGMLVARIFGVRAWPGLGCDNPAQLVLAVTEASGGMIINESLLEFSCSESLLQSSDSLFSEVGSPADYAMLYCQPRYGSYTLLGEAPAFPDSLVLGLPQRWDGRSAIFLPVFGTTVDALIDKDMQMLNLQLDNGASALQAIPFGLYEIQNPLPESISAGDVIVIRRRLVAPDSGDRG